jgi:hypothetical protein
MGGSAGLFVVYCRKIDMIILVKIVPECLVRHIDEIILRSGTDDLVQHLFDHSVHGFAFLFAINKPQYEKSGILCRTIPGTAFRVFP